MCRGIDIAKGSGLGVNSVSCRVLCGVVLVVCLWFVGGVCIGTTGKVVGGFRGLRRRRNWKQ